MAQPTIQALFGENAAISADGVLTIPLAEVNPKLDSQSSSEAIFVGLIKRFREVQDTDPTRQVWVVPNTPIVAVEGTQAFIQQVFVINVRVAASIDLDAL
jgi:hypothetical protein